MNLTKDKFQRGNVLLTGAAGYLGSFVLKYLLQNTQVSAIWKFHDFSISKLIKKNFLNIILGDNLLLDTIFDRAHFPTKARKRTGK